MKSLALLLVPVAATAFPQDPRLPMEPAAVPVEELLAVLPSNTIACGVLPDLAGLRARLKESHWKSLWEHQEFAGVRGVLDQAIDEALAWTQGAEPHAALASLQGPAVLFATRPGADSDPSLGLIVDPGPGRADFDTWLGGIESKLAALAPGTSGDLAGGRFRIYDLPEGATEPAELLNFDSVLVFEREHWVAVVASPSTEESQRLARALGADDEDRAQALPAFLARRAREPRFDAEMFVDLGALIRAATLTGVDQEDKKILGLLGLLDVQWAHVGARVWAGESFDFEVSMSEPRSGLIGAFVRAFRPVPEELASRIPRAATSFGLASLDVQGLWRDLWTELETHLDETEFAGARSGFEGAQSMFGVDFEEDVINAIDGRYLTYTVAIDSEDRAPLLDPDSEDLQIALPHATVTHLLLEDTAAAEDFVATALEFADLSEVVEPFEMEGSPAWRIAVMDPLEYIWTFTDDALLVADDEGAVRRALAHVTAEETPPSILQRPDFAAALTAGAGSFSISVTDSGDMLADVVEMFRPLTELDPSVEFQLPDAEFVRSNISGTLTQTMFRANGELVLRLLSR
jgi:hypothetical protein